MPLDYSNPHVLKFLAENFVKENEKRVSWFLKNKDKIISAATFGKDFKDYRVEDIYKASVELPLPALSCQHAESIANRRRKPLRDGPIIGFTTKKTPLKTRNVPDQMILDLEVQSDAVMKPIEPDIAKIFYEGIPCGGRHQYLKARSHKIPEEKYYLDQTTNHEIGWQLKERNEMNQPLEHGRRCTLMRELNNRTGPEPDPCYYQQPLLDPYAKCFNG